MDKPKNKGGRPKIEIDFDAVQKMCQIQCTGEEIAGVLDISYDTLAARIEEKYGISCSEYIKKHSEGGKMSLRRAQYKLALNGNPTMLVWLGKQYLGQTDKQEIGVNEKYKENASTLKDEVLKAVKCLGKNSK